jgi:hypothetical protein
MDKFENEHGFAYARAAEQADFAAYGIGREQVDHLMPVSTTFVEGRSCKNGGGI